VLLSYLTQMPVSYEVAVNTGSANRGRATISTPSATGKDMSKQTGDTDSDEFQGRLALVLRRIPNWRAGDGRIVAESQFTEQT
jgi:hypothetical protein